MDETHPKHCFAGTASEPPVAQLGLSFTALAVLESELRGTSATSPPTMMCKVQIPVDSPFLRGSFAQVNEKQTSQLNVMLHLRRKANSLITTTSSRAKSQSFTTCAYCIAVRKKGKGVTP